MVKIEIAIVEFAIVEFAIVEFAIGELIEGIHSKAIWPRRKSVDFSKRVFGRKSVDFSKRVFGRKSRPIFGNWLRSK